MWEPKGMTLPGVFGWVMMVLFSRWEVSAFTPGVREGGQVYEPTVCILQESRLAPLSPVNGLKALWADLYLSNPIPTALYTVEKQWPVQHLSIFLITWVKGCFNVWVFSCKLWLRPVFNSDSLDFGYQVGYWIYACCNANVCVTINILIFNSLL